MYKRILIITDNMRDQVNGVVTTFNAIEVEALKEGYKFFFIDPSNFKHFPAPLYNEVKLSIPLKIGRLIECVKPDHIHIATEGPVGLAGRLYCDKKGYRYNTSYHTKFPEFLEKLYHIPSSWTYSYLRWFHKHSGVVLANTPSMITHLREQGFDGYMVPWTRGVDFSKLRPTIEDRQNGSVLYVGRVSKEKNIEALCEMEDLFNIVIVGDGPHRPYLENKYKKVKFVGYKSGQELANFYRQASVFCFPSTSDTFGIVMIEAMSLGCPVAALPVTGPIDVVEDGITGILSKDLEHAIKECMKLDRSTVETHGKQWNWRRSWVQFKENLIKVY